MSAEAFTLRYARETDIDDICRVWALSFGDAEALARRLLTEYALLERMTVAEADGHVLSAMAAFDGLTLLDAPASYLYALCTHPDARGRGLGAAVVRRAAALALERGASVAFLHPASASLARWYASLGFAPGPEVNATPVPPVPNTEAVLRPLSAAEYLALRPAGPLALSRQLLEVQELFCSLSGGGFFALEFAGGRALVCAELQGERLLIRELFCPEALRAGAVSALLRRFPAESAAVLCPGQSGGSCPQLMAMGAADAAQLCAFPPFPFVLD